MIVTPVSKKRTDNWLWIAFLTGPGDWAANLETNDYRRRHSEFNWDTIYGGHSDKRIIVPTEMC